MAFAAIASAGLPMCPALSRQAFWRRGVAVTMTTAKAITNAANVDAVSRPSASTGLVMGSPAVTRRQMHCVVMSKRGGGIQVLPGIQQMATKISPATHSNACTHAQRTTQRTTNYKLIAAQ